MPSGKRPFAPSFTRACALLGSDCALRRVGFKRTRSKGLVIYYKDTDSMHTNDGLSAVRGMQGERPPSLHLQVG